jgi:hypothetical protein
VERVATALAEARAVGLEVRAETDRLIVRGPRLHEEIAHQLLAQKPVVLALLAEEEVKVEWRVEAMRPQVPERGPIPVLVAREVSAIPGHCLSCGEPLAPGRTVRCALCVRAAQWVLRWVREGVGRSG